jgi:hypothetical protein
MSRGISGQQCRILGILRVITQGAIRDLAEHLHPHDDRISESQYESTRRALKNLEQRGLVAKRGWTERDLYALSEVAAELDSRFLEVMARVAEKRLSVGTPPIYPHTRRDDDDLMALSVGGSS